MMDGRLFVICVCFILNVSNVATKQTTKSNRRGADDCKPTVVAHRGASGYVSEHTLGSYALAIDMGADYVEPDLVVTRDGHIIARHENQLGVSTDVAQRPEFASRRRTQRVSGNLVNGWFSEDFTLAEIKSLRSTEPIPLIRKHNARMDGSLDIPTFQEIIDLVKALETVKNRTIGIYPELKYSSHFQRLGLPMERKVVDIFHKNGYIGKGAPAFIQSFEVDNLKMLKKITDLRLVQLFDERSKIPYDQSLLGNNITYGQMATPNGLANVAKYASAVGPSKSYIIPRDLFNNLGQPTSFVRDAHAVGLLVTPWTFRAENLYLPRRFQRGNNPNDFGNLEGEIRAFINAGIDGFFIDHPEVLVRVRGPC
ncbi:glycerophosphodiester phosphodiesterase, periplasmic-like [Bicyclus anynana]|uniref:glycerophosphodiester phosphodiesterase n=1 Tax=Bicyclus anynana TaxID=110368 RepID=A0ABM3LDM4_BICAN|nr:glycerophosphodiester phosphodiesterase, periplasmic-like [Bicyclus anynana]